MQQLIIRIPVNSEIIGTFAAMFKQTFWHLSLTTRREIINFLHIMKEKTLLLVFMLLSLAIGAQAGMKTTFKGSFINADTSGWQAQTTMADEDDGDEDTPVVDGLMIIGLDNVGRWALLESPYAVDFGQTNELASMLFYVENGSSETFTFSEVNISEGFGAFLEINDEAVALADGLQVAAGEQLPLLLVMAADTPGVKEGTISFAGTNFPTFTFVLSGEVVDNQKWFCDFENGMPTNMLAGKAWSVATYDGSMMAMAAGYDNLTDDDMRLITPRLLVEEGEVLNFQAAKTVYSPIFKIYYSTDRANWSLLKEYKSGDFNNASIGQSGGMPVYGRTDMTLDNVPSGEGYLCFVAKKVNLDNLYGFTLVPLAHDLLFTDTTLPESGEVNTTSTAVVKVRNLGQDEPEGSYTAEVLVDGQVAGTIATPDITAGEELELSIPFTPHQAGTFTIGVRLTFGVGTDDEWTLETQQAEITIDEETAKGQLVIGTPGYSRWDNYTTGIPAHRNYAPVVSEIIYKASAIDLKKGSKIKKIWMKGVSTTIASVEMQVWMENTTDEAVNTQSPRDASEMTLVYNGTQIIRVDGSYAEPTEKYKFNLKNGFVYDGNNLRIRMLSNNYTQSPIFVQYDNNAGTAMTKLENDPWDTEDTPVLYIEYEKEATTMSGQVTDAATAQAIADATITLTSGNVIYTATTDGEGCYTINVVKDHLTGFMATAEARGYDSVTEAVSFDDGSLTLNFSLSSAMPTALKGANAAEKDRNALYDLSGRRIAGNAMPKKGIYVRNGQKFVVK